jgi:hypothetical protein
MQSRDLSVILIAGVSIRNAVGEGGKEVDVDEAEKYGLPLRVAASPNFGSCRINPSLA